MKSYISRIEVDDYKGINHELFKDLSSGINVIMGDNNSGKTRIAEYLKEHCCDTYNESFAPRDKVGTSDKRDLSIEWVHVEEKNDDKSKDQKDHAREVSPSIEMMFISPHEEDKRDDSIYASLKNQSMNRRYHDEFLNDASVSLLQKLEKQKSELKHIKEEIDKGYERNLENIQARRELSQLKSSSLTTQQTVRLLNKEIEGLVEDERAIKEESHFISIHVDERSKTQDRLSRCRSDLKLMEDEELYTLLQEYDSLSSSEQRIVNDSIDTYREKEQKINRQVENASHNLANSRAAYETVIELENGTLSEKSSIAQRSIEATVSVVLPIAFLCTSIPLFLHGLDINSLSITSLGAAFAIFAIFLAIGAFILLARNPNNNEGMKRKRDAEWILKQDEKKLQECEEAQRALQSAFEAYIKNAGLLSFSGAPRQVKAQIKDVKEYGKAAKELQNRKSSLEMRISSLESKINIHAKRIAAIVRKYQLDKVSLFETSTASKSSLEETMLSEEDSISRNMKEKHAVLLEKRDALKGVSDDLDERIALLEYQLSHEKNSATLEELKFKEQACKEQCRRLKDELIVQIMLEMIQPSFSETNKEIFSESVLRRASSYLSEMLGRACMLDSQEQVFFQDDEIKHSIDMSEASSSLKRLIYLAKKFALLDFSQQERDLPIVMDDILHYFDTHFAKRVLRVITKISDKHQVILFTSRRDSIFDEIQEQNRSKFFYLSTSVSLVGK